MILDTVRDRAGMSAGINLKANGKPVLIQHFVQFLSIKLELILIPTSRAMPRYLFN